MQRCAFGGPIVATPHLWDEITRNPYFEGVNRLFKPKVQNIENCYLHIIRTTASIQTKFCTTLKTTKVVVQIRPQQIKITERVYNKSRTNRSNGDRGLQSTDV